MAAFDLTTTQLIEYTPGNAMKGQVALSADKAQAIGETIGIDDDEITTGRIALAHLNEFPDYYPVWRKRGRGLERGCNGADIVLPGVHISGRDPPGSPVPQQPQLDP
ncbi:MAG: DUF5661 family protein [Solirubrobacteraceae bacterium]